ncbi:MAG: hypothetical protein JNM51_08005 [Bacteroidia bacterium]|nr:hypothetical protein [Bacteroidia bacterium]
MEKEELRREYHRLFYPEDLRIAMESYKLVTDAAFQIISSQKGQPLSSNEDIDGMYLFQMTAMKNLSILNLMQSLNYYNELGDFNMENLHDPFALSCLVRTQYEAFCNFNNIYRVSKSADEKTFKYLLWVLSGLKYRQSFPTKQQENIEKRENERLQIEELKKAIKMSRTYLNLDPDAQDNIDKAIKSKKWQVIVNGEKAHGIPWHEMMSNAGATDLFNGQYTSLSLNTHPSNVSVFQFKNMYSDGNDLPTSILTMKLSKWLISFFIADYCYYFEDAKQTFEKLPLMTQILINQYNSLFRTEIYRINHASNSLN